MLEPLSNPLKKKKKTATSTKYFSNYPSIRTIFLNSMEHFGMDDIVKEPGRTEGLSKFVALMEELVLRTGVEMDYGHQVP